MGKTVVVAGAGPVGALAAIVLAQRGYDVKVFEKRSLPERKPAVDDRKAYLLNLNNRSMRAFKMANVSLDDIIKTHNGAVEMVIKRADGSVRQSIKLPVPAKDPQMLRVYRDEISRHLIDEAKRLCPEAISFTFDTPLVSVDFEKQIAEFAPKGKMSSQVHFDLLVGADGAGSTVREQLSRVLPEGFIKRWTHDIVYSTGPLINVGPGDLPGHTFMEVQTAKEGTTMLYARGDGDKRVGLFTSQSEADRLMAGDGDWLVDVVEKKLVGMKSSVKKAVKELIRARPKFQKMSGWMYLRQLHGHKTVLFGDAAHTMTPVLGQGCNSGLEDVRIFAETLDRLDGNVDAALPAFTAARLPEIRALIELNEMAAEERVQVKGNSDFWHRLWISCHSAMLGLHIRLHLLLFKFSPNFFKRPALQRAQMGELKFRDVRPALYMDVTLGAGLVAAFALLIGGYASKLRS